MKKRKRDSGNPIAVASQTYNGATKGLQNLGASIGGAVKGAINTRIQEQKNYDSQLASGNMKNYYGTASQFKRAAKNRYGTSDKTIKNESQRKLLRAMRGFKK